MVNMISHQRNENLSKMKKVTTANVDKDMEKLGHSYIACGNMKWDSHS